MVRWTSLSPPRLPSDRADPMESTSSIKMIVGAFSLRRAGGRGGEAEARKEQRNQNNHGELDSLIP